MRKKVIIVWLLAVIMVLSLVRCGNTPTETFDTTPAEASDINKLEFEPIGTYNKPSFGSEYYIYRFDEPNDTIVVYEFSQYRYVLGEDSTKSGTSYANIFMKDGKFIALSNKYLLFENEEGKIAVAVEELKEQEGSVSIYQKYSFDELSDEEKGEFVFPVECEKVVKKNLRLNP